MCGGQRTSGSQFSAPANVDPRDLLKITGICTGFDGFRNDSGIWILRGTGLGSCSEDG